MPTDDGLTYGLTDDGFVAPTYLEWRAWTVRKFQAVFGKNIRTAPKTVAGRLIDLVAKPLHLVFEGARGAFNAGFFSTAPGVSLDKLLEVFNFARLGATSSTVELVLWGDNGTLIDAGRTALVEDTGDAFALDANATIALKVIVVDVVQEGDDLDSWGINVNGDAYSYAQQPGDDLEKIVEGLVAEIGDQPDYTATELGKTSADGTWGLVLDSKGPDLLVAFSPPAAGDGTAYPAVRADATCTKTGPVNGFAGTINTIGNPKTGWDGVTNQLDAAVGRDVESDEEYRARWDVERFGPGKATERAMRAAFLATEELRQKVKGIKIEETPDYFTVTVYAPDLTDDEVAQIIFDNKPLGADTKGAESGTATDTNGQSRTIYFDRASALWVWLKIVITKGELFPDLGDPAAAIAQEIAVWGDGGNSVQVQGLAYPGLGLGDDLERFQVGLAINNAVAGIKGAAIRIATTPNEGDPQPGDGFFLDADLVVGDTNFTEFDSSKIDVEFK